MSTSTLTRTEAQSAHGNSISFLSDMRAFNRVFNPSRAGWKNGEAMLEMYLADDESNGLTFVADAGADETFVTFDVSDFKEDERKITRLLNLAYKFEDVMYRLAANPFRAIETDAVASFHRGYESVHPLSRTFYYPSGDRGMNAKTWLSYDAENGHLTFRIFDGSPRDALTATWVMIAKAMVDAARDGSIDSTLIGLKDNPAGSHCREQMRTGAYMSHRLIGEPWEKDTESIRQFVDMLFTSTTDKERVITLFAANDWNPSFN